MAPADGSERRLSHRKGAGLARDNRRGEPRTFDLLGGEIDAKPIPQFIAMQARARPAGMVRLGP